MTTAALNYVYDVDTDSDTAAANVLRFVGSNKKVLEIGAGPGSIARLLQEKNGCDLTALEVYAPYVEKLKEFCPKVVSADLGNDQWPSQIGDKGFDFVVAADVLEHLYDSLGCLKNMATLLNENGSIVLSLPHAGHAVVAACLWDEDFDYREWGLLDRTHVRFFGIKNIQKLVEDAGLKITRAAFVVRSPGQTEFAQRWSRLPSAVKKALLSNRFACVYQVVLEAKPLASATPAIRLLDQKVPAPSVMAAVLHDNRVATFLKTRLSSERKAYLKQVLKKVGVNV